MHVLHSKASRDQVGSYTSDMSYSTHGGCKIDGINAMTAC